MSKVESEVKLHSMSSFPKGMSHSIFQPKGDAWGYKPSFHWLIYLVCGWKGRQHTSSLNKDSFMKLQIVCSMAGCHLTSYITSLLGSCRELATWHCQNSTAENCRIYLARYVNAISWRKVTSWQTFANGGNVFHLPFSPRNLEANFWRLILFTCQAFG